MSKLNADAIVVFKIDEVLLRITFDNNNKSLLLEFSRGAAMSVLGRKSRDLQGGNQEDQSSR